MYKKAPGNPKVAELTKSWTERSIHLGALKVIKVEVDGKVIRKCAWCGEGTLKSGAQRYCSPDCAQSTMAWGYPQKEDALGLLLAAQGWKCRLCQYSYKSELQNIVLRDRHRGKTGEVTEAELRALPWYYFKRLKDRVPKDRRPEVDHIVPIYKGGQSIGLENHQAICYTCHKTKTSKDLSGKRPVNQALLDHIEKYGPTEKLRQEAMISDLANEVCIERRKLEKKR